MVHKDEAIRAGLADYYGRQEHLREIEEKILADFPRKIAGQIQQAAKNFLRQIEQNSQNIIDILPGAYYRIDIEGNILFSTPS